jgi:LCP family protein required for cell wall assembly
MPAGEKPYRLYRGGRVKGKVPSSPKPGRSGDGGQPYRGPGPATKRKRRWLRWIPAGIAVFLAFVIAWGVAGYFQFRDGVSAANKRLDRKAGQALDDQGGLLNGKASDILLLGTDHAPVAGRETANRTDSITLVRTDPSRHRIVYLSIPRDLRVEIPGYGTAKINTAMQVGGPALAIRTVRTLTGLPVNHVVVVDFVRFKDLIDKIGGIDIDVKERIVSKFDCPYGTEARCARWPGWRFGKGRQHMDGRRALIYARVRKNALNPADTDFSRAERNQQVINATISKLASVWTFIELPFIGSDLLTPLATDLSAGQLLSLGWVKWRADGGRTLHCRLGGEPSGGGEIVPVEENRNVIAMVTGDSAPQPPIPGSGPFGPGCVEGSRTLGVR